MADRRVPLPIRVVVPQCPVCSHPQTKIRRKLTEGRYGAVIYVCTRADKCVVGFNLSKVDTWAVV